MVIKCWGWCTTCLFQNRLSKNRPIAAARPEFQPQGKTMSASSTAAKYRCVENQTNEWKNKITMLIYFKCIEGENGSIANSSVYWREWLFLIGTDENAHRLHRFVFLVLFYGVLWKFSMIWVLNVEGNLFWISIFSMSRDWFALTQTLQNGIHYKKMQ